MRSNARLRSASWPKRRNRTLEDRIRAIEDRLEIYNLIASHPPSADTGADYYTRAAYVEMASSISAAARPPPATRPSRR